MVRLNAAPGWEQTAEEVEKAIGFFDAPSPSVGENASETVAPATEPTGPEGKLVDRIRAVRTILNAEGGFEFLPYVSLEVMVGTAVAEIQVLREKLAACERERDEAKADRDGFERESFLLERIKAREAEAFEREVFMRLAIERLTHPHTLDREAAIQYAVEDAAAARAAMFPGEKKS